MRLLLVTPLYPPEPGGPSTYAKLIEDGLPSRGITIDTLKFRDVRHLPKLLRHIAFFFKVLKRGKRADVILVQDTVSCGLPATLAAGILGKRLVVRVPGDYAWEQGRQRFGVREDLDAFQGTRARWQVRVLRTIQRFVVRQANLVLVPSEYFAGIVGQWGVKAARLKVIYHGVETADVTAPTNRPNTKLIVTVGRLVPWKGFAELIQLLPELPEWSLAIVGDGPDRARLERVARECNVSDRVLFTGGLPRREALGWLSIADAFVLNSSFESFSFQVAEALSLGSAIIATSAGSIPELVSDGPEGVLVPPGDAQALLAAIKSVMDEPERWKGRRAAAHAKAARFSTATMLDRTAEAFMSV